MSFRTKTILGIALIEAILLIILVSSVLFFQHSSHDKEVNQRAKSTATLFATMTKDGVLATDLASLQSFVDEILTNPDIVYAKVIGDNIVLAQGGDKKLLSRSFRADRSLAEVDDQVFDVYAPIVEANYIYGRVELGFSTSRIDAVLEQTKNWAISIASLEIILVAIFSFVLGTWLTAKLISLKDASELIAQKGPGFQVTIDGNDEISRVAEAFNHMSQNLQENYAELKNQSIAYSKVAELASRSEAHNAMIIACCLDGLVTINSKGIIVEFNPAAEEIFGFSREQALDSHMADLIIPHGFREQHRQGLIKYLETGEGPALNKRLELQGLHREGHVFPIELTISAIENGEEVYFTAFIRDITEPKEAEEKLKKAHKAAQQASEAKSRFLAIMSHEIRTPMNVLIGTIGLLKDSALNSEQQSFIHTADDAANALMSLINDILDFSKIEADKLSLDREIFSLPLLVKKVTGIFSKIAEEKKLRLFYDIDPQLPEYFCSDPGRLQQILLNLLGNAMKFTRHGQVSVSISQVKVHEEQYTLRFEVQDTGIGISIENQKQLFSEFSQVEHFDNRRYEGTGLGLAISKKLIKLFNGEIGVKSQLGQGSQFWFTAELKHEPNVKQIGAKQNKYFANHLKILLAEDSEANIVVAKAILEKAGHQVVVARNGQQAIEALKQTQDFKLILMDIMMPEMDGIEATKIIRQMPPPNGKLPIIAMTANAMSSDKELCFQAGMNDYMSKPFAVEQLYEKIAQLSGQNGASSKAIDSELKNISKPISAVDDKQSLGKIKENNNKPIMDKNVLEKLGRDTSAEILPEMVGIFIQELKKRYDNLNTAYQMQCVDNIGAEAHALKSSSGTYGAVRLQNLAIKIDEHYKMDNHDVIYELMDEFLELIKETQSQYHQVFELDHLLDI